MMVVNSAMEGVVLGRGGGKWRPQFHSVLTAAGMVPPGRKLRIRRPISGARASLTPVTARITLQDLPDDVYESGPAWSVVVAHQLAYPGWTCNGTGTHVKPVRRSNWGGSGACRPWRAGLS